jgi:ABC-type multidrug transport system ATPase subunit
MIDMAGIVVDGPVHRLLDGCTLSVASGEVHAVVGGASAGKSVLAAVLMGHRLPSRGVSEVAGYDPVRQARLVRRHATFVPQASRLDADLTPRQHLRWLLQLAGVAASGDPVAIRRALRAAEIADHEFDRTLRHASPATAFQVWLAFADAAAHQAVILDDPTRYLSTTAARRTSGVVRRLAACGAAVLLLTSDAEFGERTADALTPLDEGRMHRTRSLLGAAADA